MAELSSASDLSDDDFQPKKPKASSSSNKTANKKSPTVENNIQHKDPVCSSTKKDFSCKHRSRKFTSSKNIARHYPVCKKNPNKSSPKFVCEQCSKTFTRADHLRAHTSKPCVDRVKHEAKCKCMFPDCQEVFYHKTSLIEHINLCHPSESDTHGSHESVRLTFSSLQEFTLWKDVEEEKNFSYFSMHSGETNKKKSRVYLYCQHDGSAKPHLKDGETRKGKRQLKGGGIKRGCLCLAHMKVTRVGDGVSVDYYPFHSHKLDPSDFRHQPLSKATYELIDQQLAWAVAPSAIKKLLEDGTFHRENRDGEKEFKKNQFVSEKLIRERKRRRRNAKRHHKDDATSVNGLYEELKKEQYNPVLIYKPVGSKVVEGPPEASSLPADDLFLFGIQTKAQAELYQKGSSKVVLVDDTHGTNQYDYKLVTVMVPDENNRSWPVAHLITSQLDAATVQYFFLSLKNKNPTQNINCVMTDDTNVFINGMELAYERPLRHLLCLWHLHQAFQRNIPQKASPDFHSDLYNDLKVIVSCSDISTFESLCKAFFIKYEDTAPSFCKYLRTTYIPARNPDRVKKWPMCHRNFYHANIETTGAVESFHSRLKKKYIKRRVVKRIDDLINILLLVEEDDYATRKRESVFGLAGQSAYAIHLRHEKAMNMADDLIEVYLPNTAYFIKSSENPDTVKYHIICVNEKCSIKSCHNSCRGSECSGLCGHMYHCSCPDKSPLCKHIHKLHAFLLKTGSISAFNPDLQAEEDNSDIVHFVCNSDPKNEPAIGERFKETRLKSLDRNIQKLKEYCESGLIPDTLVAHADVAVSELLKRIESVIESNNTHPNLEKMVPTCNFTSTQKLEKQIGPFKKPPAREKEHSGFNRKLSPNAKKEVKQNLLAILENVDDPSYNSPPHAPANSTPGSSKVADFIPQSSKKRGPVRASESSLSSRMCKGEQTEEYLSFTPPIHYCRKPLDTVLKIGSHMLNLKGLELHLSPDEIKYCKAAYPTFRVAYLSDVIVDAFFCVLNQVFPDSIAFAADFSTGFFLGRSYKLQRASGKKTIIFPYVVNGNHWILFAFCIETAKILYFDSLHHEIPKDRMKVLQNAAKAVSQVCGVTKWSIEIMKHDTQTDAVNCGVHVCLFGHQLMAEVDDVSPLTDAVQYRQFIFTIIAGGCLSRSACEGDLHKCGVCKTDTQDDCALACSKCDQWYHQRCVSIEDSSPFVCPSP